MIDLILIQDHKSGIGLFQYKGKAVYIEPRHEELFQGFLSAFQNIIRELNLGKLQQISTEDHHFIIDYGEKDEISNSINVIMMFDGQDCVDTLRNIAREIGNEFRKMFGKHLEGTDISTYEVFSLKLDTILKIDSNSCIEMS
ncbi:MAG: hypothetical protein JW776_05075 [Candidatus Lokiarchaeota archaeon]|nr:hypothetical protein [Candidatus Lokiarchaeota archaeon]